MSSNGTPSNFGSESGLHGDRRRYVSKTSRVLLLALKELQLEDLYQKLDEYYQGAAAYTSRTVHSATRLDICRAMCE